MLLRDPAKVKTIDPVTHRMTYVDNSAKFGRKVITTPSVGDVDGDGDLEVAVNVNEQYQEPPNWAGDRTPTLLALAAVNRTGEHPHVPAAPRRDEPRQDGGANGVRAP